MKTWHLWQVKSHQVPSVWLMAIMQWLMDIRPCTYQKFFSFFFFPKRFCHTFQLLLVTQNTSHHFFLSHCFPDHFNYFSVYCTLLVFSAVWKLEKSSFFSKERLSSCSSKSWNNGYKMYATEKSFFFLMLFLFLNRRHEAACKSYNCFL